MVGTAPSCGVRPATAKEAAMPRQLERGRELSPHGGVFPEGPAPARWLEACGLVLVTERLRSMRRWSRRSRAGTELHSSSRD